MKTSGRIEAGTYTEINYHQFNQSAGFRRLVAFLGVLTWPVVLPVALLARLSDFVFLTFSQIFAMVPYLVGTIVRYEFYRFTLHSCGKNVMIGFGTVLLYKDISIGSNVLIGMYNTLHYVDIGSHVLTAEGCKLLSGARYHRYKRTDVPMALQGGELKRLVIEDDCWIGANAVVMEDVGSGSIVGAGAVVAAPVGRFEIVGGVPAKLIGRREIDTANLKDTDGGS